MITRYRVAAVTGASEGIGRALAVRLARQGSGVALLARRADLLEETARLVGEAGGRPIVAPCDVGDREAVAAALARAAAELGPVDLLVANAGIGFPTPGHKFDASAFERIQRVNVLGAAYAFEAVIPSMVERRSGHLVGLASLAGFLGAPGGAAYCASKASLMTLLESLRVDLAPRGIAVSTICPGFIRSAMTARNKFRMPFLMDLDPAADKIFRAILAKRRVYAFPWPLALAARLGRLVPRAVYDRAVGGVLRG